MIATDKEQLDAVGRESVLRPSPFTSFGRSPWAIAALLGFALLLRAYNADAWSLWEDEETSIFFSQQLDKPFARFFPLFFQYLHGLYKVTGVSVASARYASALFGVLSIGLVYFCARRIASWRVALVAALLLAMNLGHLFWSQSIRYFILLFSLQLLSLYWFLEGMERGRIGLLLLSNLAFALCLGTHFSALLMMPVFVAYLFLMICAKQKDGAYNLRGYLYFGLPHAVILLFFVFNILQAQKFMSGAPSPIARDPVHVMTTSACYFGLPIIALALLAPVISSLVPRRTLLFLFVAGFLPGLELVVIAALNLSNVTWYNAFFSLAPLVILAAMTLVSLYDKGYRRLGWVGGGVAVAWSGVLLLGYYTVMHGDRPRWSDAAAYLRVEMGSHSGSKANPKIFATVPGVVAYYLGVPPGETMGCTLVQPLPKHSPAAKPEGEQWYVVESGNATPEMESWLVKSCVLKATFAAKTGPKDRTVRVYYRGADVPADRVADKADPPPSPNGSN
jgi:hypothetical protein